MMYRQNPMQLDAEQKRSVFVRTPYFVPHYDKHPHRLKLEEGRQFIVIFLPIRKIHDETLQLSHLHHPSQLYDRYTATQRAACYSVLTRRGAICHYEMTSSKPLLGLDYPPGPSLDVVFGWKCPSERHIHSFVLVSLSGRSSPFSQIVREF